jgi:gliding motility-associated-like protein
LRFGGKFRQDWISRLQVYSEKKKKLVELVLLQMNSYCRILAEFKLQTHLTAFMRCAIRYFFLFVSFLFIGNVYAQKEANIWYFGNFLGLDFNSGTAVALNDGQLSTVEGVATISDKSGQLLFYTEGTTIWNRFHQVMPNGTGLFGSFTTTQSAIIVPKIGDSTRYYVFTVDALSGPRGLNYSIVNMTLDNGKGDVEQKNIPLMQNVVEKITAVRHCNNRDIWVIGHKSVSNTFYAFLVDPSGISSSPILSSTGSILWGVLPPSSQDSTSMGYLKASPDGKKLAAAHWTVNVDVCDFNNATGLVSNGYGLYIPGDPHYLSYGVEFSPNSKLLYTSVFFTDPVNAQKKNALFQFDLSLSTPAAVRASKQIIAQNSDPIETFAALQVAPDAKMYMAKNTYNHIAAINNPNVYGLGCNYVSNAVQFNLASQSSTFGLPSFIQSYFYPPDSFTYNVPCPGSTVTFSYNLISGIDSLRWNFDDPSSGSNNFSTLNSPIHQFTSPGDYIVQLIKYTPCGYDTLKKLVHAEAIALYLGPDTLVCGETTLLLNAAAAGSRNQFLWQDGSTQPTFLATSAGSYWVQVSNSLGCSLRDTINVNFKATPSFNLGIDTFICETGAIVLNAAAAQADNYLWSTGSTSSLLQVSQPGIYWCEAIKSGCAFRDSILISMRSLPVLSLGNDTTICEGLTINLDVSYQNSTYLWQDGSTAPTKMVSQPGRYSVQVNYNGCKKSDTIQVAYQLKPRFTLGTDQYICPTDPILLRPTLDPAWQLSWQDGSTNATYLVTIPGQYYLSASNSCGSTTDGVVILKGTCKVSIPNAFTPNHDGRNDQFKILGVETVTSFHLKIFNRWGQLVFESNDKSRAWDGRCNGHECPSGSFVYILSYIDIDSTQLHVVNGTLELIR